MRLSFHRLFPAAVAAGLVFLSGPAVSAQAGIDVPLYRPYLGVQLKEMPGPATEVAAVNPDSPAALADIRPGDRILSLDGRPVRNVKEALEIIASHPPYDTVEFVLDRQGARLVRTATLSGKIRLEDMAIAKVFPIPGVDTVDEVPAPDTVEALDRMNVLKRVLLDARTGAVEFVGTYDPRYATGPLPYRELLEEGLRYPEPTFSMGEPEPGALAEADELFAKKEADIGRISGPGAKPGEFSLWLRRWMNLLMGHPLLENERQIYIARHAAVAGLTKGEFALLSNYAVLHGAMNPVPADVLEVQLKMLRNLGFENEAGVYALYREGTSKSLASASRALGKYEQARKILEPLVAAGRSEAEMLQALRAFIGCELMVALRQSTRAQADALWRDFELGKVQAAGLDSSLQFRIVPEWDSAGRPLVYRALDRMPFSNEMLRLFYGVEPAGIGLVFKDVPPGSRLGRVLYKADYVLKTIDRSQDLSRTIPAHRTFKEIASKSDFGPNILFRYELSPLEVPLFASDDRSEVGFGEARLALNSSISQTPGRKAVTPDEAAAARAEAAAYALQIQDRYEDYAREYPPLHELRETAKVLALVKWLSREKIVVRTGASAEPAWAPPERIPWLYQVSMRFDVAADASGGGTGVFHIPMAIAGGATFKTAKNWAVLGPRPPSYVPAAEHLTTSAALGELAVRAALGGELEGARELAELSAQALTGDLDLTRLPAKVVLPTEGPRRPASPQEVQFVKKAVRAIRETVGGGVGVGAPAPDADRSAFLKEIGQALRTGPAGPDASAFLTRLQTRSAASGPPAGVPSGRPGEDAAGATPAPFDCAAYLRGFTSGTDLGDGRRAFLEARITEIQAKLETVRKAMDELGRLRQGDLAALKKCEEEISLAYDEARDRAMDAMSMLLIDGPLEILQERRRAMKQAFDFGITKNSLLKNAVLDAGEMTALDRAGFGLFRTKYAFEAVYGRAERLQKTLTAAKSLYDMGQWADSDKADFEKLKEGTLQLVEMALGDEKIGGAFRLGRLTGEGVLRLLSLYKATDAACGFFYDLMKQKFVWEPLVEQLTKSLESNRQAVRTLQEKALELRKRLDCLRGGLR